ncbi:uncharacterized protein [Fopius arisanus]|uniref:C2H2-type domain-containing protein n=1 Tax=Fopius arisanus TaxID=64838 RepID=A0A9R1U837_9HYME|nr:PREDICTED: uncharacterized protein LOC105271012 [Fopius arisanus]
MSTMAPGRVLTRSVTTTRPIDMTLSLDCIEEPLSEAQIALKSRIQEDYERVITTLDEIMKKDNGQLLTQTSTVSGYQYSLGPGTSSILKQSALNQSQPTKSIKLNVLNNSNTSQGNLQLVMDPRMGLILNTVSQNTTSSTPTLSPQLAKPHQSHPAHENTPINQPLNQFTRATRQNTIRAKILQIQQPDVVEDRQLSVETTSTPAISNLTASSKAPHPPPPSSPHTTTTINSTTTTTTTIITTNTTTTTSSHATVQISNAKLKTSQRPPMIVRPTEQTCIGGIAVGNKNSADSIDESKRHLPDGREIAFNKMNGGRTFPSLVVVARPFLRSKEVPPQTISKERNELDAKVKTVLMYSATRFAEWLIQQGLVKSEQYCDQHSNQKPKLKLGMYSHCGSFPYSGGYVWISSCCPDRFVSVFSGSIFQGAPHTPSVLLKLIYHWSCQTNVQNVVSWVKISNVYVKNFYTSLRSICTAAVWDKSSLIGGKGRNIQVGVISLGTTSQDGNLRQVKVEVLGILNPETGELRLRACEPVQDNDRTVKRRFNNILQPLKNWVDKDSKILTDFTVDKGILHELGFNQVIQVAYNNQTSRHQNSNYQVMEYLRKIVPRMFQNTLSLLSRQMIQQFLDELVWREMFGTTASRAFHSIISHIAEQTRASTGENLLDRLSKVAVNPFNDWSYSQYIAKESYSVNNTAEPILLSNDTNPANDAPILTLKTSAVQSIRRSRKRPMNSPNVIEAKRSNSDIKIDFKDLDKGEQVALHAFYYGTIEGDKLSWKEEKRIASFTCFLCPTTVKSNTEVMDHMIKHVPHRVAGQLHCHVCRYCCAAFSSKHMLITHVAEAHSTFGNSDGHMVVCGICEQKFANSTLLVAHMSTTHSSSEMPYRCENCGYRTSSHKDAVDHFYKTHERGDSLQCPYCLKVMQFCIEGTPISANIQAYLVHMQRHVLRREQGRGNKCSRCCLWFNQKSALKQHQIDLHMPWLGSKEIPSVPDEKRIMIPKFRHQLKRIDLGAAPPELPDNEAFDRWSNPIIVNVTSFHYHFRCQECEEDIDEEDHYPGEQKCRQCRYVTCCWRAFKEHQQQIHNERPMTSLIVPSPLINIPLEKKMKCSCGYATKDGNLLATHFVKCKKVSGGIEVRGSTGMLDSLGLVPKNST